MAYMEIEQGYSPPNFPESVVGLAQETEMVTQEAVATADDKKLIYAGAVLPPSDSKIVGIASGIADMTDDTNRPVSVTKAKKVYGNRLKAPLFSETKTVLERRGFVTLDTLEYEF